MRWLSRARPGRSVLDAARRRGVGVHPPHAVALTSAGEELLLDPVQVDPARPGRVAGAGVRQERGCAFSGATSRLRTAGPRPAVREAAIRLRPLRRARAARASTRARPGGRGPRVCRRMPGTRPRWVHASTWTPPADAAPVLATATPRAAERTVDDHRGPAAGLRARVRPRRVTRLLPGRHRAAASRAPSGSYATPAARRLAGGAAGLAPRHLGYVETSRRFRWSRAADPGRSTRARGSGCSCAAPYGPAHARVQRVETLGFVEAFPANPRLPPRRGRARSGCVAADARARPPRAPAPGPRSASCPRAS